MKLALFLALLLPIAARAQPQFTLQVAGPPVSAFAPLSAPAAAWPACDPNDIPDAPARALRLADGTVQLYASDQTNRINTGPDLLHLHHDCAIVYRGAWNDDPAAFDDRSWIATPWTDDGKTIWAVLHDEFHGQLRKALCPSGRYMDCWYNALTLARSTDGGHSFHRVPEAALIATLPYRYDEVGLGHHGYFNPSNIVRRDAADYMFAFATRTRAQREGNCLLRTELIADPTSWRAWDGHAFAIAFTNPYTSNATPDEHVCTPVDAGALRWPITSLVQDTTTGAYVAVMQDTSHDGGVFYATSMDLLQWSAPARLLSAPGLGSWTCGDPDPIAYPALIDPASADQNFQTIGPAPFLFTTSFEVENCKITRRRNLLRWQLKENLDAPAKPVLKPQQKCVWP